MYRFFLISIFSTSSFWLLGQSKVDMWTIGYQGFTNSYQGQFDGDFLLSAPFSDGAVPFFQGFIVSHVLVGNRGYFSGSISHSGTQLTNKSAFIEPVDLVRNKFRMNSFHYDFGLNIINKQAKLSAGIGFGWTTYRIKDYRYQQTGTRLNAPFKVTNYTFVKTGKEKISGYDLRFFLNLLIDRSSQSKRVLTFKPFINVPLLKDRATFDLLFLGASFNVEFLK
ncbi:MAG: hypothetical protein AAGJ18_16150 [Bacteroidota bacterium]